MSALAGSLTKTITPNYMNMKPEAIFVSILRLHNHTKRFREVCFRNRRHKEKILLYVQISGDYSSRSCSLLVVSNLALAMVFKMTGTIQ